MARTKNIAPVALALTAEEQLERDRQVAEAHLAFAESRITDAEQQMEAAVEAVIEKLARMQEDLTRELSRVRESKALPADAEAWQRKSVQSLGYDVIHTLTWGLANAGMDKMPDNVARIHTSIEYAEKARRAAQGDIR